MKEQSYRPPKLILDILKRFSIYEEMFSVSRDFEIEYQALFEKRGRFFSGIWLLGSVFQAAYYYILLALRWKTVMFRNYVKIAVRNILRFPTFSVIKIFSLSLGIAACILISLFVLDEVSFDKFHDKSDRLFRVVKIRFDKDTGAETDRQQFLPPPMAPELQRLVPEIKHYSRYTNGAGVVRYQEKIFRETLQFVDSDFLEMFSFSLEEGQPQYVLAADHNVVLTRSHAEKYFGTLSPVGKRLTIDFGQASKDFTVSGVVEDIPLNSSLQFNILVPIHNLPVAWNNPGVWDEWNRWAFPFFVELLPGVSMDRVETGLNSFCSQFFGESIQKSIEKGYDPYKFGLQNVEEMYLDTRVYGTTGLEPSYLLSLIAFAILLIACVNFANLSIGMSSVRSLEVGMRKVLGAERKQLILQFLSEAFLISVLAIALGLILAETLLPKFNALADKQLSLGTLISGHYLAVLFFIAVFTALAAGMYPAVILSAFRPVEIMRGKFKVGGRTILTKALVVLQFSLSVILAVSALFLGKQLAFMQNRDPGYVSDGLVVILTQENDQVGSESLLRRFRSEAISISQVKNLTASNREFGLFLPSSTTDFKGRSINYHFTRVDPDFVSTMKLKLKAGRDFSANVEADRDAVIVNQKFMDTLDSEFQVGGFLGDSSQGYPQNCRVIGVIEDCHVQSLRSEIRPLLLYVGKGSAQKRDSFSRIFVRIEAQDVKASMNRLEAAWKKTQPDKPFIAFFQDEALHGLYSREKRWSAIVRYASVFSLLLACLGIFGLTAMTLNRRDKEIGIRKVLGAKFEHIVYLSVKEFVFLLVIANLAAWPVVYMVMENILQSYPYRITLGIQYFVLAGAASLLIAVLTILWLSIRAALADPAASLKYE